jgi:hypothetical protein
MHHSTILQRKPDMVGMVGMVVGPFKKKQTFLGAVKHHADHADHAKAGKAKA